MKTTKAKMVQPIMVFRNLNVAAFDAAGKQIPKLQKSIATLLAEHIESCGYEPEGCVIETQWGEAWRLFRTELGTWNHELANDPSSATGREQP